MTADTASLSAAIRDVFSTMFVPNWFCANADRSRVASVSTTSAT
ncbi:hypothetical protein AB0J72_30070 [Dactylosporangium sp. NPDC049742]